MLIATIASVVILIKGVSADVFHSPVCTQKKQVLGNYIQLNCNTTKVEGSVWLKDGILLFAGKAPIRGEFFEHIEMFHDDYSIRVFLTQRSYEGLYTCTENGTIINTYCLSTLAIIGFENPAKLTSKTCLTPWKFKKERRKNWR
ncbi:uncharacterized protein [Apostichopus japonicus]|uniref:uncharacterized protein n=1 Tax=Stichopus japonicus TaxID=307972 RepID=UPI003AB7A67E